MKTSGPIHKRLRATLLASWVIAGALSVIATGLFAASGRLSTEGGTHIGTIIAFYFLAATTVGIIAAISAQFAKTQFGMITIGGLSLWPIMWTMYSSVNRDDMRDVSIGEHILILAFGILICAAASIPFFEKK